MVDLDPQRLLVAIWCSTVEKTEYFMWKAPDLATARTFFRTCPVLINVSDEGGGDYRPYQRETFPTLKVLKAERLTAALLNYVRGKNIDRHVYQGEIDTAIISGEVDPSAVFGGIFRRVNKVTITPPDGTYLLIDSEKRFHLSYHY